MCFLRSPISNSELQQRNDVFCAVREEAMYREKQLRLLILVVVESWCSYVSLELLCLRHREISGIQGKENARLGKSLTKGY
jgi:hypothetical protein